MMFLGDTYTLLSRYEETDNILSIGCEETKSTLSVQTNSRLVTRRTTGTDRMENCLLKIKYIHIINVLEAVFIIYETGKCLKHV